MRRSLFCSFLYLLCSALCVLVLLSLSTAFAHAQSTTTPSTQITTVPMRPYHDVRTIISVKVNGAGPYDFMVDTGATVTAIDASLFAEIGLHAEGDIAVSSSIGKATQVLSTAKEISVDGLAVQNLVVVGLNTMPFGQNLHGVRGILGENFLHNFDVLIDNQHRKVTFDAGTALATSLAGERLPITFPEHADGANARYRPMVSVTLAAFGARRLTVLLDSGADAFSVVSDRQLQARSMNNGVRIKTVSGTMACTSAEDRLHWGGVSVGSLDLVACQSATANRSDHEGNMPTAIFKQIFISHAGSYAVVNPAKRAPSQEIAVLTPLAQ
jgi:predicted aspartyl protease